MRKKFIQISLLCGLAATLYPVESGKDMRLDEISVKNNVLIAFRYPKNVVTGTVADGIKCEVLSNPGTIFGLEGKLKLTEIQIVQNRVDFLLSEKLFNKSNSPVSLTVDFLKNFSGKVMPKETKVTAFFLNCEKFYGGFSADTKVKAISLIYADGPIEIEGQWTSPKNQTYIISVKLQSKGFHPLEISRENEQWYLRPLPLNRKASLTIQLVPDI